MTKVSYYRPIVVTNTDDKTIELDWDDISLIHPSPTTQKGCQSVIVTMDGDRHFIKEYYKDVLKAIEPMRSRKYKMEFIS